MKHTKLPWTWRGNWLVDKLGNLIFWYTINDDGIHCSKEDAELIIKAVNNHKKLVEALKNMICAYETPFDLQYDYKNYYLQAKQTLLEYEGK